MFSRSDRLRLFALLLWALPLAALIPLGLTLDVPDGPRIAATACTEYHSLSLTDPRFDTIRSTIQEGILTSALSACTSLTTAPP